MDSFIICSWTVHSVSSPLATLLVIHHFFPLGPFSGHSSWFSVFHGHHLSIQLILLFLGEKPPFQSITLRILWARSFHTLRSREKLLSALMPPSTPLPPHLREGADRSPGPLHSWQVPGRGIWGGCHRLPSRALRLHLWLWGRLSRGDGAWPCPLCGDSLLRSRKWKELLFHFWLRVRVTRISFSSFWLLSVSCELLPNGGLPFSIHIKCICWLKILLPTFPCQMSYPVTPYGSCCPGTMGVLKNLWLLPVSVKLNFIKLLVNNLVSIFNLSPSFLLGQTIFYLCCCLMI